MMFLMFFFWGAAYVGVFLHKRWTIPVALVALAYTLVMLRVHMTDTIPLNF
ncbi:MAG: hypothetical protein WAO41_05410 [Candidatus Nanopelagicales bacterium]